MLKNYKIDKLKNDVEQIEYIPEFWLKTLIYYTLHLKYLLVNINPTNLFFPSKIDTYFLPKTPL